MYQRLAKQKKGAAGLELYLAVIVTIFLIGILVGALNMILVKIRTTTVVASDPDTVQILNKTQIATGSSVDWFDIFITLAAAVSLVIMVVLIFRYVRASGLMGGGGTA